MAEILLTKQAEFCPIGAILLSDGEIRHVSAKIEGDVHPPSQWLIDILSATFQTEAMEGNLRAAAVAYNVLVAPPGKHQEQDAICIALEHCHGEAIYVFKPYLKTEDGSVQFEELSAVGRAPQFFCERPRSWITVLRTCGITALQTYRLYLSWSSRLYGTLTNLRPRIRSFPYRR